MKDFFIWKKIYGGVVPWIYSFLKCSSSMITLANSEPNSMFGSYNFKFFIEIPKRSLKVKNKIFKIFIKLFDFYIKNIIKDLELKIGTSRI